MNENEVRSNETVPEGNIAPEPITEAVPEVSADGNSARVNTCANGVWGAEELDDEVLFGKKEHDSAHPQGYRKKRTHRRQFPFFYVIYGVLVLASAVAVICLCNFVKILLYEYEEIQPKYKAEEVFTEHFKDPDIEYLMQFADVNFAEFESRDKVIEHVDSQIKRDAITYSESTKKESGERIYNVYSDGVRFASFSLREGERTTEHGFKYFELGDIDTMFSLPENEYHFLIPSDHKIIANGKEVSERYVSGDDVGGDAYKLTGGRTGVSFTPYTVNGFLSTPSFQVLNGAGEEVNFFWDEDKYTVTTEYITLRIPKGYTAYLESCAVGEQYIMQNEESVASAYNKFLSADAEGLNYIKYRINDTVGVSGHNIIVKSAEGQECIVRYSEQEKLYEAYPAYSMTLRVEHERAITEFFRRYTLYLMYVNVTSDGEPSEYVKKSELKAHFDTSSSAWKKFDSINVKWQFEPTRYEFVDESVSEFILYPDGSFSCRVKQTYNSWRRNSKVYTQSIDNTVFYKKSGDSWLIYNMTNTDAIEGLGQPVL